MRDIARDMYTKKVQLLESMVRDYQKSLSTSLETLDKVYPIEIISDTRSTSGDSWGVTNKIP